MKKDRKEISQQIHTFSGYEFDKDFKELAKIFSNFKVYWVDNVLTTQPHNTLDINIFHRFTLEHEVDYGYGSDDDSINFNVTGWRWETDAEVKKREEMVKIKAEAAKRGAITRKLAKEKREKTMYDNLKKKFEK